MKRISVLLIVIIILNSLFACNTKEDGDIFTTQNTTESSAQKSTTSSDDKKEPEDDPSEEYDFSKAKLSVGYSRIDITPTIGSPLSYGNISNMIHDNLYATVVAVSDGKNTVLFISLDLKKSEGDVLSITLEKAEEHGVPAENVFVSATHTHTAISYQSKSHPSVKAWIGAYKARINRAIGEALNDMTEAFVEIGRANTDRLSFTRRYIMKDGSFKGIHTQNTATDYLRHETEADPEIQAIRFVRNQKKDVVMANWQAHATSGLGLFPTCTTSDYVGNFRRGAEEKYDILFAYFDGASGNIALNSEIKALQKYPVFTQVGSELADVLGEALENAVKVDSGDIKITNINFVGTINHSRDDKLDIALEIQSEKDTSKQKELVKKYGFQSGHEAAAIVECARLGETATLPLTVISIGSIAFTGISCELFDTTGMYIKENSPYEMTFICTHTNGGQFAYVAPSWAFTNGGYEVYTTRFVKGTAEEISSSLLDALNKQYSQQNSTP